MNYTSKSFLLWLLLLVAATLHAADYPVTDFGARGDGQTLNTRAIQQAIDRCSRTGGRVVIPAGDFVTGTLYLKDNTTLYLEPKARLLGSASLADYPKNTLDFRFWGDTWCFYSLIVAHGVKHVGIEGLGTIDGRGANFPQTTRKKPDKYMNRPYLLWFANSSDIRISGVNLRSSAMWMQSYIRCDKLRISDVDIYNHANFNNDMIDIDGCRDVIISGVRGDASDDGITLKSTCDRMMENVTITNCILSSHCNALKLGTESTTGYRNITISNCVIRPSAHADVLSGFYKGCSGISLEMVDGGLLENITISNVVIDGPQVPLFIRLGNRARRHYAEAPAPGMGALRNVVISNITAVASSPTGCSITGVPGGIAEGVTLTDCRFILPGGGTAEDAARAVPEVEAEYPECSMFGTLPAYGMYIRHARNLTLDNLSFTTASPDARPALVADDVEHIIYTNIVTNQGNKGTDIIVKSK